MDLTEQAISERYAAALRSLREVAEAYYFQGRIDDAFSLWQWAEHLLERREVRATQRVEFLLQYSQFLIHRYFLTNDGEDLMRAVIQGAAQEAEALRDESAIATGLYLIGQSLYYHNMLMGSTDYTKARDNLERASALREKIGDTYGLSESLFYTGLTFDRQGPDERTRQYLRRARTLAEQSGNTWAASEAMRHLTDYTDGDERLQYALRSLELRVKMGFTRGLPPAQLLVSDVYMARGELMQALEYCQQAKQLAEAMGLRVYIMHALLTQGEIEYQQGQITPAREHLEMSRMIAHELHMARGIAMADEKLALLAGN
ncbi:MAG TPA: hypothetical protein VF040_03060 [Ktedonobacterales bacterium]